MASTGKTIMFKVFPIPILVFPGDYLRKRTSKSIMKHLIVQAQSVSNKRQHH